MKLEVVISLISALSLHAGLFCIGDSQRELPHSAAEIEIGLEAGLDEPTTGTEQETPSESNDAQTEDAQPQDALPQELPPEPIPPAPPLPQPSPPEPSDEPPPPSPAVPILQAPVEAKPEPVALKPASARPAPKAKKTSSAKKSESTGRASSGGSGHGSNISSARYRFRAPLRYPSSAYAQHVGGTVVLRIEINESGRAVDVSVKQSSGRGDLDAAAMQCARSSRYEPYRVNGQSEPCSVTAPFRFEPR